MRRWRPRVRHHSHRRSDFPDQVQRVLGFPHLRGLDGKRRRLMADEAGGHYAADLARQTLGPVASTRASGGSVPAIIQKPLTAACSKCPGGIGRRDGIQVAQKQIDLNGTGQYGAPLGRAPGGIRVPSMAQGLADRSGGPEKKNCRAPPRFGGREVAFADPAGRSGAASRPCGALGCNRAGRSSTRPRRRVYSLRHKIFTGHGAQGRRASPGNAGSIAPGARSSAAAAIGRSVVAGPPRHYPETIVALRSSTAGPARVSGLMLVINRKNISGRHYGEPRAWRCTAAQRAAADIEPRVRCCF
jgi:hypothetical protein